MKLALLLPTNDPETFNNFFMSSVDQLKFISDKLIFCINFQPPFMNEDVQNIVDKLQNMGFEVRYTFNEYNIERKGLIPFNKIRYDCARLCPEADLYALCDDDFNFLKDSDLMINEIIEKFENDKSLGVIQCTSLPRIFPFGYFKKEAKYHNYYTDSGFFFRNIHNEDKDILVYPSDALECLGACEEFIIGLTLAERGYTTMLRSRSAIMHCREYVDNGESPYGWGGEEVLYGKNGVLTYVKSRFREVLK